MRLVNVKHHIAETRNSKPETRNSKLETSKLDDSALNNAYAVGMRDSRMES